MNIKEIREWTKGEFEKIHNQIKDKEFLTPYDFLRIRNFKANNFSIENDEERIKNITKQAFQLAKEDKIKEAIITLVQFHGIAVPMASAILSMKFPDKYAIIDIRVLNRLGKDEWLKKYREDPEIYEKYIFLMRENAKKKNKGLRDYERGLFELVAEAKKGEIRLRKGK